MLHAHGLPSARRATLVGALFALSVPALAAPPPGGALPVREALVDAYSAPDLARSARTLDVGDRLHVEGLELGPSRPAVGLDLERFEVFAADGHVAVHDDDGTAELPFPTTRYFRGRVIGEPGSLAVLSVLENGDVRGIVRRDGGLWQVERGRERSDGSRGLEGRRVEAPALADAAGFACSAAELQPPTALLHREAAVDANTLEAAPQAASSTSYTVRVAIETDYELYQNRFSGNATALENYIGDLIGFASTVYDSEISTNLVVSHLSVWTTSADPYSLQGTCGLFEFGRYWNDNRTGISRTIAHFVSGKSQQAGVAWVGVLCSGPFNTDRGSCTSLNPQVDNYGGAYGFSGGVSGSFNPNSPSPVWDIVEVSHEIGHNFNSPHTHCYNGLGGSSSPVDQCYSGEAAFGCYGGANSLPGPAGAGSGTLMSYCHLLSPGLSNISLTFGTGHPYGVLPQRVPDRMRAHVESVASFAPACLARIDPAPCDNLTVPSQTVTNSKLFETCGTLTVANGFTVAATGDVTLHAGRVVLTNGFTVAAGGSLQVQSP